MNDETANPQYLEILNTCLDAVLRGKRSIDDCVARYPQVADQLRADLQVALLTHRLKSPKMSNNSVDALEAKLRQQIRSQQPKNVVRFSPPIFLSRTAAVFIMVMVLALGSGGGLVAASASSMPGDTLYPVKRLWESFIVLISNLTGDLDDTWLKLAETRYAEALEKAERGELTPDVLEELHEATENALQHASESPQLALFLVDLQESLHNGDITLAEAEVYTELLLLVEPAVNALPDGDTEPAAQQIATTPTTMPSPTVTQTHTLTLTTTPSPTVTVTATETVSAVTVPQDEPTNTATATSRIPPTPTRTPTPTNTIVPSVTPSIAPSSTFTPLPPPTIIIRPTLPVGGATALPTLPPNVTPEEYPTWYPWMQATQDAFYMTRTAEWGGNP